MKYKILSLGGIALAMTVLVTQVSYSQLTANFVPATGDWDVNGNWDSGFVPDTFNDESAAIGSGKTATVSNAPGFSPGAVTINGGGAINIASSGTLTVDPSGGASGALSGAMNINANGNLSIASGGTLNASTLNVNGSLNLTGPSANVSITGNAAVGSGGTVVANINSASFAPISAGGSAGLNGTLRVNFSGVSPTPSNSWTLVDAPTITGRFVNINVTGASSVQPWQEFVVSKVAGGAGQQAKLGLVERLLLTIDHDTGNVTISNPGSSAIAIDGYAIRSAAGSITPGGLNSFDEQGVDGNSWQEIGVQTSNAIAELHPVGQESIAPGTSRAMGKLFAPAVAPFGTETDDLTFSYVNIAGETINGKVHYTGTKTWNNVVVVVDPVTGQAVLQNQSTHAVTIEGFVVTSAAGSITPGTWNSLQDQGANGGIWYETLSNSNQLGELTSAGAVTLSSKQILDMGKIFTPNGARDLQLQFLRDGENVGFKGAVSYGALPTTGGVPGDYNGNGTVDAADYTVWKDNFGSTTSLAADGNDNGVIDAADYTVWKDNFGNSAAAASLQSVPEPASGLLLAALMLLVPAVRRRATA
ncbi:MAG: hypothetical protein R3E01_35355 [Pirellulaceae bacterium]|nr:hypothetical protein [Planctomycetales bacterium]